MLKKPTAGNISHSYPKCLINILSQKDAVALIGRGGEGLLALQHIIKIILRAQGISAEEDYVKVDIDSYRSKQEMNVLDLAERKAAMVMESGRSEYLPPMSSFFRRLVHLRIKEKFPELETFSQGDGNHRSVCIAKTGSADHEPPADLYADLGF